MKKKLLSLLVLLLPAVGAVTAWAQSPDATPLAVEEVPTGCYYIASTEESIDSYTSPFIVNGSSNVMALASKSDVTTDHTKSMKGLWYITKVADYTSSDGTSIPKYTIRSAENTSLYWVTGPTCPLGGDAATYYGIYYTAGDDSSTDGYYQFRGHPDYSSIGNKGAVNWTGSEFGRSDAGSHNKWKLIPVSDYVVTTYTTTFTFKGRTYTTSQQGAAWVGDKGNTVAPSYDFVTFPNCTETIAQGSTSVNLGEAVAAFPFEEGKFYAMTIRENARTNHNVVWNTANSYVDSRYDDGTGMSYLWTFKFTPTESEPFLVKVYTNAKGVQKAITFSAWSNNGKATLTDEGTAFAVHKMSLSGYTNGFRLANPDNNNASVNDVLGNLGVWIDGRSTTDDGSTLIVTEATEQPVNYTAYSVRSTQNNATASDSIDNYYWLASDVANAPLSACIDSDGKTLGFYTLSSVTATDGTLTASATPAFPFTISTDEAPHYYYLRTRDDAAHNIYYNASTGLAASRYTVVDPGTEDNFNSLKTYVQNGQWEFRLASDDTFNQFYISPRGSSVRMTLAADASNNTDVTMTEAGSALYVVPQATAFTSFTGGFSIQPDITNGHAIGDHKAGSLSYWSSRSGDAELNDGGSIFRTTSIDDEAAKISTANATFAAVDYDQTVVGEISKDKVSTFTADTYSDLYSYFAAYDAFMANADNCVKVSPDKIYTICFKRGTQYVSSENAQASADGTVDASSSAPRLMTASATGTTPANFYRFKASDTDGQYYIQNVNSGLHFGTTVSNGAYTTLYEVGNTDWGGRYSVAYNVTGTRGELALKDNVLAEDNAINNLNHNAGQYLSAPYETVSDTRSVSAKFSNHLLTTTSESTEIEPGCVLYIKEVTEYPVNVKSSGYASLSLPFAVTLPESGDLKAYIGTATQDDTDSDNNSELTLQELTGTIPANTGVILGGAAGDYTLGLALSDATAAPSDNLLTGTSVRRTGFEEKTYYGLARKTINGEQVAGFFLNGSSVNMAANKAFLLKSKLQALKENASAAGFRFNFGGKVTGIGQATATGAQSEPAAYYDLNGRRVLYPTRGIYVKSNGQKVFVK